jgi:hypothetical protein
MSAQLLFFTGVAIGAQKQRIETILETSGRLAVSAAVFFLIATNYMEQMAWMTHHFDQKQFAGPLRLAELLAVMVIVGHLSRQYDFSKTSLGIIETCGRHTLPVFTVSTVGAVFFSYLSNAIDANRMTYAGCVMANVVLCLVIAQLLERHRSGRYFRGHKTGFSMPQLHRQNINPSQG